MKLAEDKLVILRPDFGPFNPKYNGNKIRFLFYTTIFLLILVLYSVYFVGSFIEIFKTSTISIILNGIVLLIEGMLAYYTIILIWHFSKGFASINSKLTPIIKLQDLETGNVPSVSILLSTYKEPLSIVSQSLKSSLDLKYPKEKVEIAVVEDESENTDIEDYCRENNIKYLSRNNREHFKAGAINLALPQLRGDYILFIDADHILEPNIIGNCLRSWRKDTIAVQTRIDFVNMVTFLTTVAAFLQMQFFSLFQRGRRSTGSAIFAGGAAMFDRKLLIQEGGMDPLTIADDTDTSFILHSRGYRIDYIDIVGAWALVPWDPLHLMRQIWRWMTGITRSFRSRWKMILTGKSTLYAKIDHFSTGIFPTIAVLAWLMGILVVSMVRTDIPMIRLTILFQILPIGILPLIIGIVTIFVGVFALSMDDPNILYKQKSLLNKISSIGGFYLLIVVAQPLLLGAVVKGIFGLKVSFNRTPKEKQHEDSDLSTIKLKYLIYAISIFIAGLIFFLHIFLIKLDDPRIASLLINAYAGMVPLIISLFWYWKLEKYLLDVNDITALEFLKNLAIKRKEQI